MPLSIGGTGEPGIVGLPDRFGIRLSLFFLVSCVVL